MTNERRPCKVCGKPSEKGGIRRGHQVYNTICGLCHNQLRRSGYVYGQHKKDKCEQCGFVPIHPSQLVVDHVDGNRKNNSLDNLQTLCHNCHFLKNHLARQANKKLYYQKR